METWLCTRQARALGRDDRWMGNPTLPDEKSVGIRFGLPSPRAFLKASICSTSRGWLAPTDFLLVELEHSSQSWLGLVLDDADWAVVLGCMLRQIMDDFPLALAESALHAPLTFRTAGRKATRAVKHDAYEASQNPSETALPQAFIPRPFQCGQCDRKLPSLQQLTAHRFAVYRSVCTARQIVKGTVCPVCLTQFWTKQRLVRHYSTTPVVACLSSSSMRSNTSTQPTYRTSPRGSPLRPEVAPGCSSGGSCRRACRRAYLTWACIRSGNLRAFLAG